MNGQEQHIEELIQAYVKGKLKGDSRTEFETVLAQDVQLRERVEKEQLIQDLFVRKSVNELFQTADFSPEGPSSNLTWFLGSALLLMLLGGIGYWFFQSDDYVIQKKQSEVISQPVIESNENKVVLPEADSDQNVLNVPDKDIKSVKDKGIESEVVIEAEKKTIEKDLYQIRVEEDRKPLPVVVTDPEENPTVIPQKEKQHPVKPCRLSLKEIAIKPACLGKQEGSFDFTKITFGVAPYEVYVNGSKVAGHLWTGPAGNYLVKVIDGAGCVIQDELQIVEELCVENKIYVLNTSSGKSFSYPVPSSFQGTIQILNQAGEIVWKDEIVNGYPDQWNGYSLQGSMVTQGAYILLLQPQSGKPVKLVLHVVNY